MRKTYLCRRHLNEVASLAIDRGISFGGRPNKDRRRKCFPCKNKAVEIIEGIHLVPPSTNKLYKKRRR